MHVVERVLYDQAFAVAALNAELGKYPQLSSREGAFATEVAYTTLRTKLALESRLAAHCPKGIPKDRIVHAALIVAAAQILMLDQANVAVAVDAAVTRVRSFRGAKPAGFVNAVLRRLAAGPRLDPAQALRSNAPDWLYQELVATVGAEQADALLGIGQTGRAHCTDVRVRPGRQVPAWLADAPASQWLPQSRSVSRLGDLHVLPGWDSGDFVIQEQGAQLIAWALDLPEGARVLDACAGRGQKTTLLADRVGPGGTVWATDLHPKKLSALTAECERLQITQVHTAAVDWAIGGGDVPRDFEYALVDAPCTGSGTMHKRPEILMRLTPGDPLRMSELTERILRNVAQHCQTGAQVVYAVCSVLPAECERVLDRVADLFEPAPFTSQPLRAVAGPGATQIRLLPLQHGTDGYFVACLKRR